MLKILSIADHMSGKALFKYETVPTSLSKHPVSCPIFFSHRQTGKNRLAALGLADRTGLKILQLNPQEYNSISIHSLQRGHLCC